ncbi:MAG: PAS domain-containing sensor histidine kinase [Chloroflexota bacterium]
MRTAIFGLQQGDNQRAALFDSIADGYYEADLQGNLRVVNRALSEILGCDDLARVTESGYSRFIDVENLRRLQKASQRVLKTGSALKAVECMITRADGERRCLEVSIALLCDDDDTPLGFHGIVRDVTRSARTVDSLRLYEHLQFELAELKNRYTELSEVEQLKTHMIRVTAHDLRSPLSIISSYIELLDEDLAAHYGELDSMYVNAIRQAVARMLQMTTDILSLERLREYRDVTLIRVQLLPLLERTLGEFAGQTRQRRQQISLNAEPVSVYGESVELHEALANLVGNAIKYTPEGGTIEARLRREGDFVVLEIIDSGYGIPADQQEHLFEPFHRVKTRETYAIDGTGLGLYLVRKIVEQHGGSVHFQSEYGKGSLFGFRLPLAK